MSKGFALIADLYTGGVAGSTGGVLCGGAAMLLRWLCGKTLALVFCVFFAILTLLGAMNITIPSIIRAIANRPKDDYAEEIGLHRPGDGCSQQYCEQADRPQASAPGTAAGEGERPGRNTAGDAPAASAGKAAASCPKAEKKPCSRTAG